MPDLPRLKELAVPFRRPEPPSAEELEKDEQAEECEHEFSERTGLCHKCNKFKEDLEKREQRIPVERDADERGCYGPDCQTPCCSCSSHEKLKHTAFCGGKDTCVLLEDGGSCDCWCHKKEEQPTPAVEERPAQGQTYLARGGGSFTIYETLLPAGYDLFRRTSGFLAPPGC